MERKEKHDGRRRITPTLLLSLSLLATIFANIPSNTIDVTTHEVTTVQSNWDCDEIVVQFQFDNSSQFNNPNINLYLFNSTNTSEELARPMNQIRIRNNHIILLTEVQRINGTWANNTVYIPFSSTLPCTSFGEPSAGSSEYENFQVQRFAIARNREMIRIRLSTFVMDLVQNGTAVQTFLYANTTAPSPFSYAPRPSTIPRLAVSVAVVAGIGGLAWSSFF